jgi:uncharacterized membrane protein
MAGGIVTARRGELSPATLARGLGWFSIGLGVAELLAPRALTRTLGLRGHERLIRAYGLREIGTGIGILAARDPSPWIWGRVGGDALDMATVAAGFAGPRPPTGNVALSLLALAGVGAVDLMCAEQLGAGRRGAAGRGVAPGDPQVERSITIGKPAEELHRRWRDPETVRQVAAFFMSVTPAGEDRARWRVEGPLGRAYEGEVEITDDRPGEAVGWHSLAGADVPSEGAMRFRPAQGGRGTVATLRVRFDPPGGALGAAAMKLLGGLVPATTVDTLLHRFKSLVETGEIPTTEHQPAARADTR